MRDSFYDSPEWRSLSADVVAEADGRCAVALLLGGACDGPLHAHHIVPRSERLDLALDRENLAAVCARHHPSWEALRRALVARRTVPPCNHRHPYPQGRIDCERRRARALGIELPDAVLAAA
jgi:5-methylcytosine-specific restriction endonuclease McrA